MSATYPTKLVLAFRSGGVCAFPKCGKRLTYESKSGADTYIGEAAHIRGEKPGAARYDAAMTDDERDDVRNLIYLCTDHHTLIDKVPEDWTTAALLKLKAEHELRVREATEAAFADVAFPELEHAIAWVKDEAPAAPGTFDLVSPEDKIKKNELSNSSRHIIAAGMMSRATVAAFVEAEAQLDSDFPERLKAGFLSKYYSLRQQGVKGDALFDAMCSYSQQGSGSQGERTAGLAVLVYLFEICDVFEK